MCVCVCVCAIACMCHCVYIRVVLCVCLACTHVSKHCVWLRAVLEIKTGHFFIFRPISLFANQSYNVDITVICIHACVCSVLLETG